MGTANQGFIGLLADAGPVPLRAAGWARWPAVRPSFHNGGVGLLPDHWPAQGDVLQWCHDVVPPVAVVLILLGIVYLMFGFSFAKVLVTLNATLLGAWLGALIGHRAGGSGAALPAAVVTGLLAATVAWPTLRGSVAVLGGGLGAVLGVIVWRLSDLDPTFGWSGGLTGLVLCGLLSLLLFRPCVITYTSLQGAAMLVFGTLALILKHDDFGPSVGSQLAGKPLLLPMAIFVPTLLGYIYQQSYSPAPAGPPAPPRKG